MTKDAILIINQSITLKEKILSRYIDTFLMSNKRIDRDKVIKKREQILTLKELKNELL